MREQNQHREPRETPRRGRCQGSSSKELHNPGHDKWYKDQNVPIQARNRAHQSFRLTFRGHRHGERQKPHHHRSRVLRTRPFLR